MLGDTLFYRTQAPDGAVFGAESGQIVAYCPKTHYFGVLRGLLGQDSSGFLRGGRADSRPALGREPEKLSPICLPPGCARGIHRSGRVKLSRNTLLGALIRSRRHAARGHQRRSCPETQHCGRHLLPELSRNTLFLSLFAADARLCDRWIHERIGTTRPLVRKHMIACWVRGEGERARIPRVLGIDSSGSERYNTRRRLALRRVYSFWSGRC